MTHASTKRKVEWSPFPPSMLEYENRRFVGAGMHQPIALVAKKASLPHAEGSTRLPWPDFENCDLAFLGKEGNLVVVCVTSSSALADPVTLLTISDRGLGHVVFSDRWLLGAPVEKPGPILTAALLKKAERARRYLRELPPDDGYDPDYDL